MTKTEPRSAGSGGGREKATPTELLALASALEGSQQQCDEDGTMIAVSRQAVHESLKALREFATTLSAREDGCPRCKGLGYIDDGHENDDSSMASAIETCPDCIAGWQPIDTAPKDGRFILLFDAGAYLHGRWNRGSWWSPATNTGRSIVWHEATHWQPLPKAPTAGEGDV